jgi:Lipid A 3-O-deacylase (PagL)
LEVTRLSAARAHRTLRRASAVVLATLLAAVALPGRADEAPAPPAAAAAPAPEPGWLTRTFGEIHPSAGVGLALRWPHVSGKVAPVSITWKEDRYELFAAYFQNEVVGGYHLQGEPAHIGYAPPHFTYALSRRFNVVDRDRIKAFAGIGVAYEGTKLCRTVDEANDRTITLVYHGCDKLNGSHWNYLLQLGVRYYNADRSQGIEFAYRHISNAGLAPPNLGDNFLTLLLVF